MSYPWLTATPIKTYFLSFQITGSKNRAHVLLQVDGIDKILSWEHSDWQTQPNAIDIVLYLSPGQELSVRPDSVRMSSDNIKGLDGGTWVTYFSVSLIHSD